MFWRIFMLLSLWISILVRSRIRLCLLLILTLIRYFSLYEWFMLGWNIIRTYFQNLINKPFWVHSKLALLMFQYILFVRFKHKEVRNSLQAVWKLVRMHVYKSKPHHLDWVLGIVCQRNSLERRILETHLLH